jgi:hypothetical protein
VNGYWFGDGPITSTPSNPDKYLFLPAAGYNDTQKGNYGDYWSSTSDDAGTKGYKLVFNSTNLNYKDSMGFGYYYAY